ncbi:type IV pilin biogenesis protein [Botrimarina colliarenosi]|uniref:Type IV pilin biogenesis protein n=1 Tax=Botrimarina colliarenosi TaxID=2528001 RepID=A0A5C6AEX6_9BACT|nr:type II secretion system F family protein [Botrimarina colliarenosi]TWT97986.1 type IV pilin biogenesis protein [Botrimarina colliarenosi]
MSQTLKSTIGALANAFWEGLPTFRGLGRQAWWRMPTFRPLFGPRRATPVQRSALLRLIATASEERLPLASLLAAWAGDERGGQTRRLERLAAALRRGVALPDALERVPGALSDEETLMVRFASESGTLATTIRSSLHGANESTRLLEENLRRVLNYLTILLIVAIPIALWVLAFVHPAFHQIVDDFGVTVPAAMQIGDSISVAMGFFGPLLLVGAVLLVLNRFFRWPGQFIRRRIAPLLSGSIKSRRMAGVMQRLGESATAGRPLAGAVSTLARHHFDPSLRHKLLVARNELALGAPMWPTLASTGLLSEQESSALAASEPLGVSGWVLTTLAEVRRRHALRWMVWQSSLLVPIVIFLFGGFVLVQVLGVFTFLTDLVFSLARPL